MQYFNQEFLQFFKELAANNNKEWFHANKKRYETSVKTPFETFVADMIKAIQKKDPTVAVEPKDCILRINRDIRFAKDKSPYNLHRTAIISSAGRKDKSVPGLFLRFSPEAVAIMGGAYVLDKNQLAAVRNNIAADPKGFKKIITKKAFKEKFGAIKGEAIKRIPKEMREAAEQEPLILNKQFYFVAEREPAMLLHKNLIKELMTYWTAARPVNEYFYNCFK